MNRCAALCVSLLFVLVRRYSLNKLALFMSSQWLPRCQFYFRRLMQTQPIALSAAMVASVVCVGASALYVQQAHGLEATEAQWRALNQQSKELGRAGAPTSDGKVSLTAFNNTQLLETLKGAAENTKLTFDEVSFVLEPNANQPYLRYRATLTVTSQYPTIRKFLDQVRVKQPEVSLDSILCTRDDIATVELTCDLAMSAFYRNEAHG
jgi:hypothetical protein